MKRSREDIQRDIRKAQAQIDSLGLEVALMNATANKTTTNQGKIIQAMNMKADELKKAELWLRTLETELANSN